MYQKFDLNKNESFYRDGFSNQLIFEEIHVLTSKLVGNFSLLNQRGFEPIRAPV